MQKFLIRTLSYPPLALGFIWQFIAGSFYAGRILSVQWISGVAKAEFQPTAPQQVAPKAGLH